MFLVLISLITGYIGLAVGSSMNAEGIFGLVGFLCPTVFILQKIYIKLEELEKKL